MPPARQKKLIYSRLNWPHGINSGENICKQKIISGIFAGISDTFSQNRILRVAQFIAGKCQGAASLLAAGPAVPWPFLGTLTEITQRRMPFTYSASSAKKTEKVIQDRLRIWKSTYETFSSEVGNKTFEVGWKPARNGNLINHTKGAL